MKVRYWLPLRNTDFILLKDMADMRFSDVNLLSAKPKWLIQTCHDLALDEGFRQFAYPDPRSKLGRKYVGRKWGWGFQPGDMLLAKYGEKMEDGRPWTYGYGFTYMVKPNSQISKQAADRKLEQVTLDHFYIVEKMIPNWKEQPDVVVSVVLNMAFNMGERLFQFKPTMDLIVAKRYKEAAARLRHTAWYKQVGERSERLCRRLETGVVEVQRRVV